ncbi:MAG: hypothetical protein M0011_10640 [Elusimicrobia bacterium]|nr:hypothetical protein [Elusimicrobiota bacterium]
MKVLRKAGFPLLVASVIGFRLERYYPGNSLFYLSFALMVLGGVLFVVSPFIGRDEERSLPSGAPPPPPSGEDETLLPELMGVEVPAEAPSWVYLTGALMVLGGAAAFFAGPNGVNTYSVSTFSLIPLGVLVVIGGKLLYGTPAVRSNVLYGALALFSFLLVIGGIFLGVFIAAGAFSPENSRPYGVLGLLGLIVGMAGAYFGMSRQRSGEGRAIGAKLGFVDAGSGDGIYDSKGFMNGLEVFFDVDQRASSRGAPPSFMLQVLCRCPNSSGLRLSVKPENALGVSFGSLPRVPDVPHWDFYDVRCDRPGEAMRILPPARREPGIFSDAAGFTGMSLEGGEFKFSFTREGCVRTEDVKKILEQVSLLASKVG